MHFTLRTFLVTALFLPLAGLAIGCSGVRSPYDATADPYRPTQVQVADKRLEAKLAFQAPRAQRDEAGLLHVTIPVRATTNRPQIVQYRFTFLDEGGTPLPGGDYRTVTLESNTFNYLQGNSTTPRAANYQVEIRTAR